MDDIGSPIIATRDLRVVGTERRVVLALHAPRELPGGEWECSFTASGLHPPILDRAFGIDAFQALIQALEGLRSALEAIPEDLTWIGDPRDAGLPRSLPMYFGPEFAARLGRMVDAEVERHATELARRGQPDVP